MPLGRKLWVRNCGGRQALGQGLAQGQGVLCMALAPRLVEEAGMDGGWWVRGLEKVGRIMLGGLGA